MPSYTIELSHGLRSLSLGKWLGEGAAGNVFRLPQMMGYAAKIYKSRQEATEYEAKISTMLECVPALDQIQDHGVRCHQIAWPTNRVFDSAGGFIGFTMPEIDFDSSHPLESILQKNSRRADKIDERYELRVVVATNMAIVFTELHRLGHHMIDMKPDNLRFYPDHGYLAVIDADGFSIRGPHSRFPSHQFTDNYIAPEGRGRRPETMGVDQDRFALAVILFQLLNNGLHPYGGVTRRGCALPSDLQSRIYANLYAYGIRSQKDISPAPTSIHQYFDDATRGLFDRAFLGGGGRPTAREWRDHLQSTLKNGRLITCSINSRDHAHFGKGCGLCEYERTVQAARKVRVKRAPTSVPRPAIQVMAPPTPAVSFTVPPAPPATVVPPPALPKGWQWWALGVVLALAWCSSRSPSPPQNYNSSVSSTGTDYASNTTDMATEPMFNLSRFEEPVQYIVTPGDGALAAKLRSGPGNEYRYVARLPTGETLTGYGRAFAPDGTAWISVTRSSDGTQGFVAERLLRRADEASDASPSFACSAATAWDERMICEDSSLAAKDREMAGIYGNLLSSTSSRQSLETSQQDWLRNRRRCQSSAYPSACLHDTYDARIRILRSWPRAERVLTAPPAPVQPNYSPPQPRPLAPTYSPPTYSQPEPARLRGGLNSVIRSDDYPSDALRQSEAGTVTVQLRVSAEGRVVGCSVVGSSGSGSLDRQTCNLFTRRGRYEAATGSDGKPRESIVQQSVTWRLSD